MSDSPAGMETLLESAGSLLTAQTLVSGPAHITWHSRP